jgi:hypothetical protein
MANASKSFGVSPVTMPTAVNQPLQLGSQATQVKRIGSLRSSRTAAEAAVVENAAARPAMLTAKAHSSAEPLERKDRIKLNPVPFPRPRMSWQIRFGHNERS